MRWAATTPTNASARSTCWATTASWCSPGWPCSQFWGDLGVQTIFRPRSSLRRRPRAQSRHRRFLLPRPAHAGGGLRAAGRSRTGGARNRAGGARRLSRPSGYRRFRRPPCRPPIPTWTGVGQGCRNWTCRSLLHLGGGPLFLREGFPEQRQDRSKPGPLGGGPTKSAPRTTWWCHYGPRRFCPRWCWTECWRNSPSCAAA